MSQRLRARESVDLMLLEARVDELELRRDELEDVTRRVGDAFASGLDPDAVVDLPRA